MTNDERDAKLTEIHADMKVFGKEITGLHKTIYGNSKPGIVKDVTLLQERQVQCPARKASTTEGKRLTISHIMMVIAIIGLITTIVMHVRS